MAVRGHNKGKFYSEFSNESWEQMNEYYKGIPEITFLHDVEAMAFSIVYHPQMK